MKNDKIKCFSNGYLISSVKVKRHYKCGLIDKFDKEIIANIYDKIQYFGTNVVLANIGYKKSRKHLKLGKWGVLNLNGDIVVPFHYSYMQYYNEKLIVCYKNKWGLIDLEGKIVVPIIYDYIQTTDIEDLFLFELNDKQGIFDIDGIAVVDPIYYEIDYKKGLDRNQQFSIQKNDEYYCINSFGKIVEDDENVNSYANLL